MFPKRMIWLALALSPGLVAGQLRDTRSAEWRLITRGSVSGGSQESTPDGYVVYSGLALEAALARRLGDFFALELSARTETREIEGPATLPEVRLGSLAMIPLNMTLKWHPRAGSGELFQPYAGAGLHVTAVWEKSGLLDSTNPPVSVGPVIQLGCELVFSSRLLLSLDAKWNPLDVELEGFANPAPTLVIDPLTLGAGFGFAF